jgi:arylsulfatase A-like enzyme
VRKWLLLLASLALVGVLARTALPALVLRHPRLLALLSEFVDPIGPPHEVAWEAGPATATTPASERPPNVVLILVDDLGWNDLSWRGGGIANGSVPTPHIDSIAQAGVEFTAGYAGNATCAPSRAAILTGRYPGRFGFESTPAPPSMGYMASRLHEEQAPDPDRPKTIFHEDLIDQVPSMDDQGVPASEITLAELLQAAGYHTLMLGKWHLGASAGLRPDDQGFDEFLGFRAGASFFGDPDDPEIVNAQQDFDPIDRFIWQVLPFAVRKNSEARFAPAEYMTDYLSNEAAKAIAANRNRPFFLYLAYNAPHTPLQATMADYEALAHIEHHPTRVYAAMLRSLDRGVGRVLAALDEYGLAENTLVIFSSDNGGAHYIGLPEINYPYRGWKMTFFEGGLRAPFFMRWPAALPANVQVDEPVAHIDVFSTVAAAANLPLPADRTIDGIDLLPFARGNAPQDPASQRDALFWRSDHYQTVRSGGWKLQVNARVTEPWLYHLAEDPTEQLNLAARRPDKLAELMALLERQNETLGPPAWPSLVEGVIPVDRTQASPYEPGETYVYWPN